MSLVTHRASSSGIKSIKSTQRKCFVDFKLYLDDVDDVLNSSSLWPRCCMLLNQTFTVLESRLSGQSSLFHTPGQGYLEQRFKRQSLEILSG